MDFHLFKALFFIFGSVIFFTTLRNYHTYKTQNFAKIYFLIMILFSMLSFFYGLYYFILNDEFYSNLIIIEKCIYIFIYSLILSCIYNILNDNNSKFPNIFYILPFSLITYLINNFNVFSNEGHVIPNLVSSYIFRIYCLLIVLLTSVYTFYKTINIKHEKHKPALYIFSVTYLLCSLISLYIYDKFSINTTLNINHIGVFINIIPMFFMHRIVCIFNFGEILPQKIITSIVNSINEIVIITDANNNIVYVNSKAEKLIPTDTHTINEVFTNPEILSKLEEKSSKEVYINTINGSISSLIIYSNVRDKFDEIIGKIFIFQNIRQLLEARHKLEKVQRKLKKKIEKRTKELEESNEKLKSQINDRVSIEYQIMDVFCYDTLTALYNRSYFIQNLERTLYDDKDKSHALMFIDLDGFKSVNDSLGHSYGDDVLISVSNRLRHLYKYKNVVISRFGGDEFVILFKDISNENYMKINAQNILDIVREPIYFDNAKIYVSASIGISIYPKDGITRDEFTKNADVAMYKAKESGKNQYKFFEKQYKLDIEREYELTHDLLNAINENELILYYQPQISIVNKEIKITGFESLIRWKKNGELIPPGIFIPVSEKSNIILDMGRWIVYEACLQGKKWADKYKKEFTISINLSSNQIMNPMIYDEVSTALIKTGVNPKMIEFEITETSIVKDIEKSVKVLKMLKELGVRISVDDFGTKYSTFSYLKNLPIDKIKIDMSFIRGINKNKIDEGIILSLISLSKEIGMDIIAEGVETKEEIDFLYSNNCMDIQGFFFFPPLAVEDIEMQDIMSYSDKLQFSNKSKSKI